MLSDTYVSLSNYSKVYHSTCHITTCYDLDPFVAVLIMLPSPLELTQCGAG